MAIKDVNDLCLMIDSHVPIIVLETYDELQALELLTRVAIKKSLALKSWSVTKGLSGQQGFDSAAIDAEDSKDPKAILAAMQHDINPSIYALCDFHPYLAVGEDENIRLLKDAALEYKRLQHTIVLVSHSVNIPPELKRLSAKFEVSFPSDAQLIAILREEIKRYASTTPGTFQKPDTLVLRKMISNLRGLSAAEARRLIRAAIVDDGVISASDIPAITKAKFELLDMSGVISFEYDTERFSDVGGLMHLKTWVQQRQHAFLACDNNDKPRGVMLLGVQGGGKSLAAKAVAGLWSVPLLRLDMGALYNKYIGETEKNLRTALAQAEMMSPCVLWIDEIEKSVNTKTDSDVAHRVLGTLLTWMAEHTEKVFVVSTANDISLLPPELMRKGRMDEIFFVDLPSDEVRKEIFSIHLVKRELNVGDFDLDLLAQASDGFVGAEIEQAIVSALYSAKASLDVMNTDVLLNEITKTYPLSVVMAEKIAELRHWAKDRTVSAG